jgi:V8-like Glu-specific endopeptidase
MTKNTQKTTARVSISFDVGLYHFQDTCTLHFFGKNADSLNKEWDKKISSINERVYKNKIEENKNKIKELEEKIANTPRSFFNKKRKHLEEECLYNIRKYIPHGISGLEKVMYVNEFLSKYDLVLISESNTGNENIIIYEIYDRKH